MHVPMGDSKHGWYSFLSMLKSFGKKRESLGHQENPDSGARMNLATKNYTPLQALNATRVSYADVVKIKNASSSYDVLEGKQSTPKDSALRNGK